MTVVLKGGVSVDADILWLALALEAKGVRFTLDAVGNLQVGPTYLLTPADFRAARAARHELARIVRYVSDVLASPEREVPSEAVTDLELPGDQTS